MRLSQLFALFWCCAAGAIMPAAAESEFDISVNGSTRASYFTSSRDLDGVKNVRSAALWLQSKSHLGSHASISVEGWSEYDVSNYSNGNQAKVREAYLDLSLGALDLRLGRQIIAWGRADKLNPTDNLTPRDYTLNVVDDEQQRLGAKAAMLRYPLQSTGLVLTGIWMPQSEPNVVPLNRPPGVIFIQSPVGRSRLAAKLEHLDGGVDWSVSYLDGASLNPEFKLGEISGDGVRIYMQHKRMRVLGVDAATVWGQYGLRAEAAYTWTNVDTSTPTTFSVKPFFYLVVGGDRTFADDLNVNLQYFVYRVSDYVDPRFIVDPLSRSIGIESAVGANQLEPRKHGLSIRVGKKWLHGKLDGEIAVILSLGTSDFALRPKLSYAINDRIKLVFGANLFRGNKNTYFGRLADTSTIYSSLNYSF